MRIKNKNFTLVINEDRARQVFSILEDYWTNSKGVFSQVVLPQNRFPVPENYFEQAQYLFFAALPMRGGVNSDDPFRWMWHLYKKNKNLFYPDLVVKNYTESNIVQEFRDVTKSLMNGTGKGERSAGVMGYKLTEHAKSWIHNARSLAEHWQGDVMNIFQDTSNFEEAFARIDYKRNKQGFITGMRRKIFSLFTIWLFEKGLLDDFVKDVDNYPIPIPVDFHCLRVLWATKVIDFVDKTVPPKDKYPKSIHNLPGVRISEKMMDEIALWSYKFIPENGFSFWKINPAVWVLSRDLCKHMVQNHTKRAGEVIMSSEVLLKNPNLWPNNGNDPCRYCPLENYCTGASPAQPYYKHGYLIRLERLAHPQQSLTGLLKDLDWSEKRLRGNGTWLTEVNRKE